MYIIMYSESIVEFSKTLKKVLVTNQNQILFSIIKNNFGFSMDMYRIFRNIIINTKSDTETKRHANSKCPLECTDDAITLPIYLVCYFWYKTVY